MTDRDLESRVRAVGLPLALIVAFALVRSGFGRVVLRTFISMWVHETGHAVTAWLCGFPSFPGPWFTPVAGTRSFVLGAAIALGLAYLLYRSIVAGLRWPALGIGAVLVAQLGCTLVLRHIAAQALFFFGGDAGCLVLGTLLMLSLYARPGSTLHRGGLRFGFLVIGAIAFADAFEPWWAARTDVDRIPFGMNEGVGLSDPSMLAENFGWSEQQIVSRYVTLGCICLVVLTVVYLIKLRAPLEDDA
jgi:hypothetical protein